MRFICFILLTYLTFTTTLNSQIVEASAGVNKHIFQIEAEAQYAVQKEGIEKNIAWAFPSLLLRYGLLQNIELQLGAPLIKTQQYENDYLKNETNRVDFLQFGLSVNLWKQKKILPQAAIMGVLIFPFNNEFQNYTVGKIVALNFSNTITEKLSLLYNIGYTYDTELSNFWYYIINLNFNLNDNIYFFIENFSDIDHNAQASQNLNVGGGYNFNNNLSLVFSVAEGLNHKLFYTSLTLNWSINTKK